MWRKNKKMNNFVFSSPTSTPLDLFLLPVACGLKKLLEHLQRHIERPLNCFIQVAVEERYFW
jgi:hypothetical protein